MDISSAIDEYLGAKQKSITQKTLRFYTQQLTIFERWCTEKGITDLTQVTTAVVQNFVADCPTNNTYSRHHRAQVVKGFLSWCCKDDEMGVKKRTVRRIEMPKIEISEITLFTDAELLRLLNAVAGSLFLTGTTLLSVCSWVEACGPASYAMMASDHPKKQDSRWRTCSLAGRTATYG